VILEKLTDIREALYREGLERLRHPGPESPETGSEGQLVPASTAIRPANMRQGASC
jgi:hypothetical protein